MTGLTVFGADGVACEGDACVLPAGPAGSTPHPEPVGADARRPAPERTLPER
ncbi:hypothetical protein [Xylanimonas protaetiae]|uniref:hypothetical protein n=1 Tax=Xylanimonas protaetiae TaxID=2509457 RepID=UPI0013EC0C5B|nr:hypothetical protein [Xylanimonas protaetiae]